MQIYLQFSRMQRTFTERSDVKLVQMSGKTKFIFGFFRFSSKTHHFIDTQKKQHNREAVLPYFK